MGWDGVGGRGSLISQSNWTANVHQYMCSPPMSPVSSMIVVNFGLWWCCTRVVQVNSVGVNKEARTEWAAMRG